MTSFEYKISEHTRTGSVDSRAPDEPWEFHIKEINDRTTDGWEAINIQLSETIQHSAPQGGYQPPAEITRKALVAWKRDRPAEPGRVVGFS